MTTDAIYRCKCRVGFFGRNCEHNVCQARASEPMQQSHQRSYDDSILKASGSDAVHDAFSGMNAFGEPVKPHKKQELDDSAYYSQRRKIRYAGQNASEGLIQSSGKHRVIRPPASYFQTWEGRARSYFSNASAPAMSELHPIIMLQYERDALYFYCYNSKCEHSEDHHRVRFRCHCPPEWSSVDESNGMCRFRFVCGEQDQMECSSRGAVCVPRSASTGVGLVAQCECPVGFVFNSDRICQPICDFAGKTCERFQADKCEPTLHRNRVRCLCQAGHVFDAEFGRCVVATDVLRVRMNVRLNLLWPFEYALNAPAPPATSDDNRAHNFDEYAHEDDLFVPSIADDIIGPATFAPDLPDTQPPALNPINCLHYHQTGACVDWLQQVRNQQRQSAANLQKQLQLRMRMRQSLQLTFDQLVGPEAIVKITVLSLPNESSGSITDFTVEFTVDVMSPDRFAGRKLLDLFQVTCVRIDRLNQVYLHPPLLIDSIKYDDLGMLRCVEFEIDVNGLVKFCD